LNRAYERLRDPLTTKAEETELDASGVECDPADLDHRGTRGDLEAVGLGWQWHPGAEVFAEPYRCVAEIGQARVDPPGAGVGPCDGGARADGGWKPGAGQQDGLAVQDVATAAEYSPGVLPKAEQCSDVFRSLCLEDLDLIDGQVAALGLGSPHRLT
jgi:hypothetical protein